MGELHQTLAVIDSLKKEADQVKGTLEKMFTSPELFCERKKTFQFFDDERQEKQKGEFDEYQKMATTVGEGLAHFATAQSNFIDALACREVTNQEARADIVVDGTVLVKDAPVSFLIKLEEHFTALKGVYDKIPTLYAGANWVADTGKGEGIWYLATEEIRTKKEKMMKTVLLHPADENHPAQVAREVEEEVTGRYTIQLWSGMITESDKKGKSARLEKLIRAIKKARSTANSTQVKSVECAKTLFDFVNNGL